MTTDRATAGRSAVRRGQDWQRRGATWLRDTRLYPNADHVGSVPANAGTGGRGDLLAIGDRVIEMTVQPWDKLAAKLRQAEGDATVVAYSTTLPPLSVTGEYWVWRPAPRERGGVGRSLMITRAEVAWPLLARLDRLERDLAEAHAELETLREA